MSKQFSYDEDSFFRQSNPIVEEKERKNTLELVEQKEVEEKKEIVKAPDEEHIDFHYYYEEYIKSKIESRISGVSKLTLPGFVGWIGGKKRTAKTIANMFPQHGTYVEIFMGSAAVFFEKRKVSVNVINDINDNLVNLYRVVSNKTKMNKFMNLLYASIKSPDVYKKFVEMYDSKYYLSMQDYERAYIYWYIIQNGFNKDAELKKFGYNQSGITDKVFQQLASSNAKLSGTIVENTDYSKLIIKYNKPKAKKGDKVLFFADPPYVVADDGKYYENVFTEEDHRLMAYQMGRIAEQDNYFFITYDDHPLVRELYKDYVIDTMSYTYTSTNNKDDAIRDELVITNYKISEQLTLI